MDEKTKGGKIKRNSKSIEKGKLSLFRVIFENAFAGVKGYGAVNEIYCRHKDDFDDKLMLIVTGELNLYLMAA